MPSIHALAGFALASLLLVLIPGPSVLFTLARTLSVGRRGGFLSLVGNTAGQVPLILAVAFGVGAIVASSFVIFTIIKFLGAAYLVYLGVQTIRHRHVGGDVDLAVSEAAVPARTLLWQGFVVGVTNPKSIVFFLAVLPQFVDARAAWAPGQMMILGGVFLLIALASDSCYMLLAGAVRNFFVRTPRRFAAVRTTGGVMMIGLGAVLAAAGHETSA